MATPLDFYDESALQDSTYARVLLTGDRKVGKTVSVLTTAPGPCVVLNADGQGAPQAAKRYGAKNLRVLDVTSPEIWERGCKAARDMALKEECRTIVVDTITLLVNVVIAIEMSHRCNDSFDIWKRTYASFMDGLAYLKEAPSHVFYLAHYDLESGLLTLDGKLKKDVPALVHDIVHLDFKPGRTVKGPEGETVKLDRAFMIGPSASGLSGGRHSDENKLIPADVTVLLKELGIAP